MPDQTFFQWRPHPWHGLSVGSDAPRVVNAHFSLSLESPEPCIVESPSPPARNRGGRRTLDEGSGKDLEGTIQVIVTP